MDIQEIAVPTIPYCGVELSNTGVIISPDRVHYTDFLPPESLIVIVTGTQAFEDPLT